jgi:DNA gyrase subunit B
LIELNLSQPALAYLHNTIIMPEDYDISQIQVISSLEAIRKRPGMYFRTIGDKAIEQFVYELVSNVADCYLSSTATWVSVAIDEGTIIVSDDGPGLPFDVPSGDITDISMATKFLTTMHFTGSEDGHAPHVHVKDRMGMGLAVLNAVSSQLKIQSWRDGTLWEQEFSRGVPLYQARIVDRSTANPAEQSGTKIAITPDPEIFPAAHPQWDVVRWHLFETAHLVRGLEIRFQRERFYAPQGLLQLLPFLSFIDRSNPLICPHASPQPFQATVKSQDISIDAVAYGSIDSSQPHIYSWVNGAMSPAGGSHVTGFLSALAAVGWQPASLLIHVVMFDPEFAGPTRTQLAVPKIAEIVKEALTELLQQHLLLHHPID